MGDEVMDLDVSNASADGIGLTGGVTLEDNEFTIFGGDLPPTTLRLRMEGPSKTDLKVGYNFDGTYTANYRPTQPGDYKLWITFGGKDIPNSPFTIPVQGEGEKGDATKVELIDFNTDVTANQMSEFQVNTTEAGFGKIQVQVQGPAKCELKAENVQTHLFNVGWMPTEQGVYQLSIRFSGDHIENSPFIIKVK